MISNAYSGGLSSMMTIPRYSIIPLMNSSISLFYVECSIIFLNASSEKPIDTAHDLAETNQNWGATQNAWIFSILDATEVSSFSIDLLLNAEKKHMICFHFAARYSKTSELILCYFIGRVG